MSDFPDFSANPDPRMITVHRRLPFVHQVCQISIAIVFLAVLLSIVLIGLGIKSAQASTRLTYESAQPGYEWSFPRDHGAHPEYRTEWWYFTGRVEHDNSLYGYQLTVFSQGLDWRARLGSPWMSDRLIIGHVAISGVENQTHEERMIIERAHPSMAGADTSVPGRVSVNGWLIGLQPDSWTLTVPGDDIGLDLTVTPTRPHLFHGKSGYSRKGPQSHQASQYYSYTRMSTDGHITVDGERVQVEGRTWFDHEFGSSQLSDRQTGWDWISLRLDDGSDLMVYRLREQGNEVSPTSQMTVRDPSGNTSYYPPDSWTMQPVEWWESPESGARYPVAWTVKLPSQDLSLTVKPRFQSQEMISEAGTTNPYWEGIMTGEGQIGGEQVRAEGYLELTGYAGSMAGQF